MWIIYTTQEGQHYPLEIDYKLINSTEIQHDYEQITSYCRDGCPDYGSGGCPPYAPALAEVAAKYPYGIMVYAKFFSRFKPPQLAADDFSLQDVVLSDILSQLGYAVLDQNRGDLFFLNCGHCRGCGDQPCSFKQGDETCREPERRAYSIAATGVDVSKTLQEVFGITLQWLKGNNEVEYIIKVMALLSPEQTLLQQIAQELRPTFNSLACIRLPIGSRVAGDILERMLAAR